MEWLNFAATDKTKKHMKSNEILEKLIGQTKDLHTCLVLLRNEQGTIHELDRDSIRHQLRAMYTLSAQLTGSAMEPVQSKTEFAQVQLEEPEMHVEIIEESNILQSAINEVLEAVAEPIEPESVSASPIEVEPVEPQSEPMTAESTVLAGFENANQTVQTTVVEQAPQKIQNADSEAGKSLADRFAPSETFGDMIQRNQPVQRVSDKLRSTSLSDLHESIGINERFAFINQLFKGDQAKYFEAINRLNESHSQDEALSYLNQEVLPKMAWKNPPSAWKEFVDLISRRYQA